MLSSEKIAYTIDALERASFSNSFTSILTQFALSGCDDEILTEYNGLIATFLYGSDDLQLADIIEFIEKLELTADTKSIVDHHIWLLKRQPRDHMPQRTLPEPPESQETE